MAILATLKNAVFKKIQDSPGFSQWMDLQSAGEGADDAEVYHPAGFYSKQFDDNIGVVIDAGDNNIIVASHNYKFDKDVDKGEAIIYSIDEDGNILSSAKVDKDGKIVINDGTRSAVAFDKLKEGFDQLKADYNDLESKWTTFANAYVPGGPLAVGTPPTASTASQSTASVNDSEVDKVLLP